MLSFVGSSLSTRNCPSRKTFKDWNEKCSNKLRPDTLECSTYRTISEEINISWRENIGFFANEQTKKHLPYVVVSLFVSSH